MMSETDRDNVFSRRHDPIENLSDTVILLRYVCRQEISVAVSPAMEVVKMRMTSHSREIKPFNLKQDQEEVYSESQCVFKKRGEGALF